MRELLSVVDRAAQSNAKVLITGESGVGKDLIARRLHSLSERAAAPFIAVNCAGLTDTLLESELFGHVKGSFTGAYRDKRGKVQHADGGTLFLDEVAEMSLRMQALLLRFLQNGEVQAVGSDAPPTRVDVRIIAATNRDLSELVAAGHFREDLLYRLRVVHLHVPPLRQRPEDVASLTVHFLQRAERSLTFTDEATRMWQRYAWPGNVRELRNVVEQLVWTCVAAAVEPGHLPASMRGSGPPIRERRRQVADDLYDALVKGGASFWEHVYPMFLGRDITRRDVRELVRRGLRDSRGRYKLLLPLFGMPASDYRRFMNFLAAHDIGAKFKEFRPETSRVSATRVKRTAGGSRASSSSTAASSV